MANQEVLFEEKQKFTQVWVWAVLILLAVLALWGIVQQVILGKPFGTNPAPDLVLILFSLIPFGLLALALTARLETSVTRESIRIRFRPFMRREISWSEVAEASARTYRPLREYGGWGIRLGAWGFGRAYTMSGREGIQLVLKDGKKLLIGTQLPAEIEAAVKKAMQ